MSNTAYRDDIISIEDTINDLNALLSFSLHMVENCTPEEFGEQKSAWCTMMYLLREKVRAVDNANGRLFHIDIAVSHQREDLH